MKLAIYNLLVLLLIPVFLVRILLKSFSDVDYRINLLNRFSFSFPALNKTGESRNIFIASRGFSI